MMMELLERIKVDPAVHLGKPCVRGTRIPVDEVLELVAAGTAFDVIYRDYYLNLTLKGWSCSL